MYLIDFFNNRIFFTVFLAWLFSCLLKGILVCIREKKFDFRRFWGSGGMPSSHTTLVMALATAVGIHDGFDSVSFVICCVFAFIVMYDASGVRRAAGQQARIINTLINTNDETESSEAQKKLKELLGHTPIEVAAGAIIGVLFTVAANILVGI